MFGSAITFANPALWYAASAATVPIILHLVLRTRARRVVLPTMQFVKLSHQVSRARLRLRQLLLLAMRIAALLLIISLLAGTQVVLGGGRGGSEVLPMALVVAIDNSASMSYKEAGRSHLAWGKLLARQMVEELPDGSQVAMVSPALGQGASPGGSATNPGGLGTDRALVGRQIDEIPQSYQSLRVDSPLRQALAMLARSTLPRRAVLLITDRTAAAWTGVEAQDLAAEANDAAIYVPDCWQGPPANVALGPVRLSQAICPLGASVQADTTVSAVGISGPALVELHLEGKTIDQRGVSLTPGASGAPVSFRLTPEAPGVLDYSIHLAAPDALECDNARYFSLVAEPLKTMLVVREAAAAGDDTTAFIMSNAVAPAGQTAGRLVEARTIWAAALAGEDLRQVALVMLAGIRRLPAGQWDRLGGYIAEGGRLWIVPEDGLDVADYSCPAAKTLLPVELRGIETLAEPMGVGPAGATEQYLSPFVGTANPPLSEIVCHKRLRASGGAGRVVLAFADGVPAIAERRVGTGRVLWWAVSPARSWSNLASDRLAQLPILARQAAATLLFDRPGPVDCYCGEPVRLRLPEGPIETAGLRDPAGVAQKARVDPASGVAVVEPDRPGRWYADLAGPAGKATQPFTVNVDPVESDLRLLSYDELRQRLGGRTLVSAADPQTLLRGGGRALRLARLDWPLALAATLLLIGESFLANRFYRQAGK
jgi:hypothetical protein